MASRDRDRDADRTVRRRIDVASAFREADQREEDRRPTAQALVPMDAVPVLIVPRSELPWNSLGKSASQLLLRVDGVLNVGELAAGTSLRLTDAAREIAALVTRGIMYLVVPDDDAAAGDSKEINSNRETDHKTGTRS